MIFPLITLLTALVISSVAIYYSVSGLAAIFAASVTPIIIMGASLEVGKLVTAVWLHKNWKTAPTLLKSYFMAATLVLMFITSMGIFGFLSRAHIEQSAPIGDVAAQIEMIDAKIQTKKEEITNAQTTIKGLDEVVNQYLQKGTDVKSVTSANNARKQNSGERTKLQKQIDQAQKDITKLNEEKFPLSQKIRKAEVEVGPIKYIAQFVYGPEAGKDLLERAVTWMIFVIIFVFDPLAVLLLIASQIGFEQATELRREMKAEAERQKKEKEEKILAEKHHKEEIDLAKEIISHQPVVVEVSVPAEEKKTTTKIFDPGPVDEIESEEVINEVPYDSVPYGDVVLEPTSESVEDAVPADLDAWNKMIEEAEKAAAEEKIDKEPVVKKKRILHDKKRQRPKKNPEEGDIVDSLRERVKKNKIFKPMDFLYNEYILNHFADIDLTNQDLSDPEMMKIINYVDAIQMKEIQFEDIPYHYRQILADLITRE